LNVFIYNVITCFIKYELNEFELNQMNVYVWYNVISMFVNDKWYRMVVKHCIIRKGNNCVEIVSMCIVGGFGLKRYRDSTSTFKSHRWKLPSGGFERCSYDYVWDLKWVDQNKTYG